MTSENERRLLQAAVAAACLVPLAVGALGVLRGPEMLRGVEAPVAADLDSHFRYLSGLLLGIGLAFAACIPRIERVGPVFRLLGLVVILGGFARLASLLAAGMPGAGHAAGLIMELVVVPALLVWQARVARTCEPPRPL